VSEVRDLLELAADREAGETPEPPVRAVVAAGRARTRRRLAAVAGSALAVVAVAVGAVAVQPGPTAVVPALRDRGELACAGVRFDPAALPGQRVTAADMAETRARMADLAQVHGWPRIDPYQASRWTVVPVGSRGVLVATTPRQQTRYAAVTRTSGGRWSIDAACTPAPAG
jgi:hypothetical protein